MRERGLKQISSLYKSLFSIVVPRAGTWIETGKIRSGRSTWNRRSPCGNVDWNPRTQSCKQWVHTSFPVRERGLKPADVLRYRCLLHRRSPCGNVDWNHITDIPSQLYMRRSPCGNVDWNSDSPNEIGPTVPVVPRAGTWIETLFGLVFSSLASSRSPCGNVDWNFALFRRSAVRFQSFPVRERGLKHPSTGLPYSNRQGRSPCGNVDWNKIFQKGAESGAFSRSPCGNVDWNLRSKVI